MHREGQSKAEARVPWPLYLMVTESGQKDGAAVGRWKEKLLLTLGFG